MDNCDDDSPPIKPENECHRFFGYSKRIPRDVKRHCGMCRQHGVVVETRGHVCQFKSCACERCGLIRQRRSIMSTQIRLRRQQDKRFQRTTNASEVDVIPSNSVNEPNNSSNDTNMCYFCQKCKNHGVLMWKKDHKRNCQFATCRCEQCHLIDTRRALDQHIKRSKSTNDTTNSSDYSSLRSPEKLYFSYDNVSNIIKFPTMNAALSNSTETRPVFTFNDVPLLKSMMETSPLLLPTTFPVLLPTVQYPSASSMAQLPSPSFIYGAIPPTRSDHLITNMFNTFSPFEIQLLLGSTQPLSIASVGFT